LWSDYKIEFYGSKRIIFADSACISKNYMLGNLSKNESLLCMSRDGNRSKSTVSIRFAQQSIEKMKGKHHETW